MPPVRNSHTRGRSTTKKALPTKKALLVGISYASESGQKLCPIPTSIPNVKKFKAFLQDHWGYTDITVITDEDGVEERLRPTAANLEREMGDLCHGVKPGDRRVFYFAGHSDQMPCKTGSEEDSMDETLVALNGLQIRDNKLYELLVKDLPKGSALVAIFDACTSGTLLDLPHYKCNNVYRPWVNKGKRGSNTLQNFVVRKDCGYIRSMAPSLPHSSRGSDSHYPGIAQTMDMHPPAPPSPGTDTDKHQGERRASSERQSERDGWRRDLTQRKEPPQHADAVHWVSNERCASPERQFECDGWCCDLTQRKGCFQHADVISISSSNDGQTSWDASTINGDSLSMTSFLVNILKKNPQMTYNELMARLNHEVHSFTMKMHKHVQKHRRDLRENPDLRGAEPEEDKGEMDNFQDLQLGSITPLDMSRLFML